MKTANKIENKNTAGFQSEVLRQTQEKVTRLLRIICQSETERGTFFFHSDTGTGKTTGFIRAVIDLVKTGNTFGIAVHYQDLRVLNSPDILEVSLIDSNPQNNPQPPQ